MDNIDMILNASGPSDLMFERINSSGQVTRKGDVSGVGGGSKTEQKCKELCKGFESILIEKMLDEMKNTIGQWDDDEDPAAGQIFGIFSYHMAEHMGKEGGFGLWKDVYESLNGSLSGSAVSELDDEI